MQSMHPIISKPAVEYYSLCIDDYFAKFGIDKGVILTVAFS